MIFFFHNCIVGAARHSSINRICVNIELHYILYPSPSKTEATLGVRKSLQETRLTAGAEINSFHPPLLMKEQDPLLLKPCQGCATTASKC